MSPPVGPARKTVAKKAPPNHSAASALKKSPPNKAPAKTNRNPKTGRATTANAATANAPTAKATTAKAPTANGQRHVLGIDIGGSGIKGAPVDLARGALLAERHRIETPAASTPDAVLEIVKEITEHFRWSGAIGVTFPGVVKGGRTITAANVDEAWIDFDVARRLRERLHRDVVVLNDADAAGLAEITYGVAEGRRGVVVMVTLGTGIGTALFLDGRLVPNTELGHIEIKGRDAEESASARVREEKELSWKKWGKNVNRYLSKLEALLWPDLFVIGGGVSTEFEQFREHLRVKAEVVAAELGNDAGIVGAALAAELGVAV